MGSVKFNLLNKKQDLTPIYLIYSFGGSKPLRWSTGKKINPKKTFWDYSKQRARKAWPTADTLNSFLDNCQKIVIDIHNTHRVSGKQVTVDVFKTALNKQTVNPSQYKAVDFLDYCQTYIDRREKSGQFSQATYKNDKKRKGVIEKFFKESRRSFSFAEWDLKALYKLKSWLIDDKGYKSSYAKKVIQFLSAVLEESFEEGLHDNTAFNSKYFSVQAKESDHIALTEAEVLQIANFMAPTPSLEKTRDRFVVGCYVGQRFSDLFKIDISQMYQQDGAWMFRFKSKKVLRPTIIPIHPVVYGILEKYGGKLPAISNVKFNKQLKDLFELAGFTEMTTVYEEKRGEVIPKAYPKFKLITTHTMRRTFITNALEKGIPDTPIMDVAGITNHRTLMRYNKSKKDRSALTLHRANLFQARKSS